MDSKLTVLKKIYEQANGKLTIDKYKSLKTETDPSVSQIKRDFDTWKKAKQQAGLSVSNSEYTRKECLEALNRVAQKIEKSPKVEDVTKGDHGIFVSTNLQMKDLNDVFLSSLSAHIMENTETPYGLTITEDFDLDDLSDANDVYLLYQDSPENLEPYILFYGKVLNIGIGDLTDITSSLEDEKMTLSDVSDLLWSKVEISEKYEKENFEEKIDIPDDLIEDKDDETSAESVDDSLIGW
jgi:hypothetical protein